MNRKSICLFLILQLSFSFCFAQIKEEEKEKQMEEEIESIAESDESEIDNSVILEDMATNSENPVNINTATADDLERLNILDFRQVQNIINYRKSYGNFVSVYELGAVEGFTPELINSLLPFVTFEMPSDSVSGIHKGWSSKAIMRVKSAFPESEGYRSQSAEKGAVYPGMPVSFYSRYHFDIPGKIEMGFIADNDAGEDFFTRSNKWGFDYYSGFIALKSKGLIRQLTIGDYLLRFGQGLNFGVGSSLGKSGNVLGIMKSGQGVRPSTSTDENRFFRGVAATLGKGPYKIVLFYSNKYRDANIISDPGISERYFTSFQSSGYHRTSSETEDEKSVNEQMAGIYGELRQSRFRVGAIFAYQRFSIPMDNGPSPYKKYSFSGDKNFNAGVDYQIALHNIQFFGEAGLSGNGKPGAVQGLIWHPHPQISWALYYRYFDPGFHTFYGSSLSESSGNRNESGVYTGLVLYPLTKVKLSCYVDIYHFPWLTYSTMAPGDGSDYMAQVDISFSRRFSCYLKGKVELKPQKISVGRGISADYDEMTTRLRIHAEYVVSQKLTLRTRAEYAGYALNDVNEKGFLFFQDLLYSPFRRLKMWFRYARFNTDGYNSRVYAFENDLLYSFSIPEFHGTGQRVYLNLKWSPALWITAYLKGGITIHDGASSWGSGYDTTSGNNRIELKGQLYLRF